MDQGICGEDPNAISCFKDHDCVSDYKCYVPLDSIDGSGKCIPADGIDGDTATDGDEPPACTSNADCDENEICFNGYCKDALGPGDEDADVVDTDPDLVEEDVVEKDNAEEESDGDQVGDCERSSDCPAEYVCVNGACVQHCSDAGCDDLPGSHCNPNNGFCEYCDDLCAQDRCCNFYWEATDSFWYCGSCCVPSCPAGKACQSGQCIDLKCPSCEADQVCNASTGYVCKDDLQPDGDGGERGGMNCLPANAECLDGVDICCSGTCLMGTCL
ncbi:MAG: hypothetical protein C4523_11135 [Myxococcales bacterium]|nr:MAG: hypothetical protein C4523_11135 [Myxococcales bacterium]